MKKLKRIKLKSIKLFIIMTITFLFVMQNNLVIVSNLTGSTWDPSAYGATVSQKVSLNKKTLSMYVGESITLKATISPSKTTSRIYKWSSSNKEVAIVSSKGTIKALSAGTVNITVKIAGIGKAAICKVKVFSKDKEVTAISLNYNSLVMDIDEVVTLEATVLPQDATTKELSWSSTDESTVYVDSDGSLFPCQVGTAVITAEVENGIKAECTVQVIDETIDDDGIIWDQEKVNDSAQAEDEAAEGENNKADEESIAVSKKVVLPNGKYIITLFNTGVSLDVANADSASGGNVQVYPSNGSSAQIWSLVNNVDGTLSLAPECAQDKVLDIMRTNNSVTGELQSSCNADIYTHNDNPAQHFYVEQFSNGSYVIRLNSNSNLVLQAASTSSGANVTIQNYDENNSVQRWSFAEYIAAPVVSTTKTAFIYNTGGAGVFVRSQQSTTGTKVGGFAEGQTITVTGELTNEWYPVKGTDRNSGAEITGYTHRDYVTFTQDDIQTKIVALKTKFPSGAYWNHIGGSNNPDGYTWTPCTSAHTDCNGYSNAWQCHGFALKLGYDVFGSDPRTWSKVYNLNNLHPGDIIRYANDGHTVFVTAVSGNTVKIADCNSDYHCKIRWDRQMTKSDFYGLNYVLTCQ